MHIAQHTGPAVGSAPFSAALALTPSAPGDYSAELAPQWTVAGGRVHGGVMLALATRAALRGLAEAHTADAGATGAAGLDPLAVSADFLRVPDVGPARLRTEVVKVGRTVSVVRVRLSQHDRPVLDASVTAGRLPEEPPVWSDPPEMPAEPPPDALRSAPDDPAATPLSRSCDIRIDRATFRDPRRPEPLMRGWVRPLGEAPDLLFALFAGDALPPVLINLGVPGWSPTAQLTALLRARPVPGWLRMEVRSRSVGGGMHDEDSTVLDAQGRVICQARQLALAPRR